MKIPKKTSENTGKALVNNISKLQSHIESLPEVMDKSSSVEQNPIQKKKNGTGLPDNLKWGIEALFGFSMDDVKVHYNSDKPTQLHSSAYAEIATINLGSTQEQHLPHEAWHVVLQKEGRVKPTSQPNVNISTNEEGCLEKEADALGLRAQKTK